VFGFTHLHFLYVAPILLATDVAVLVLASLLSRQQPPAQVDALMFTAAALRADSAQLVGVPPWRNYRVQAAALLLLTALVVIVFR
jgi:SSS family solute:Na+ symporter